MGAGVKFNEESGQDSPSADPETLASMLDTEIAQMSASLALATELAERAARPLAAEPPPDSFRPNKFRSSS
jgi:hypothetical protein